MGSEDTARLAELAEQGITTWADMARIYFPQATDDEAQRLLMGATAYPCAGLAYCERQVRDLAKKFANDPHWLAGACADADSYSPPGCVG